MMPAYPCRDIAIDGRPVIDREVTGAAVARLAARGVACKRLRRACNPPMRLPIRDQAAPGRRGRAAIAPFGGCCDVSTASGYPVTLCCEDGGDRSGTVAAFALMRQGCRANPAITQVRAQFAGAVASDAQRTVLGRMDKSSRVRVGWCLLSRRWGGSEEHRSVG